MNKRGLSDKADAETRSIPSPKRPKSSHYDSSNTLQRGDYTIAWVCALHTEMAAAQIMLDQIHPDLPRYADDSNTYILGSIKQHNIAIACLPEAYYGTNNAVNVMTNMKRTFPALSISLMVGIGGGVPGQVDIRLGDVVIGTRVMQYDLGKVLEGGRLFPTAVPRILHHSLGTAVSALRSKHELEPDQLSSTLKLRLERYPSYGRPSSPDQLFHATYDHNSATDSCDGCDHSKLVSRSRRASDNLVIHYGAIASGNRVMKNGATRDQIADKLNVICFEMEAAGLMDILPCLPIRGICDYSDSHKNKEWQRYAAAAAAAYARGLIEEFPVTVAHSRAGYLTSSEKESSLDHRQHFLDSLRFDQIDSRRLTIRSALARTCGWFLNHPGYQAWLDRDKLAQHHGFLWVSGKPGAGKSTIMKFAHSKSHKKHDIVASFFFNARGEYLEKSVSGMYRSLLLQLLEKCPLLQGVLDDRDLVSTSHYECPPLAVLKELFCRAIFNLEQQSFACFVDALDECDEQQVVDMVDYFETLTKQCKEKGIQLRICFSSRHYPYIAIQHGMKFTLEDQSGHAEDLSTYVKERLKIKDAALFEELKFQLLEKAGGVFMWIVLVVEILNKEERRGGFALRKRLAEIPSDLSELFRDIMRRDNGNMEGFRLCILWILLAERPLKPDEFYHALWSGLSLEGLADPQLPDCRVSNSDNTFEKAVIGHSKGLAEITKSKQPTVQFIHESVRDFLCKEKGLQEIWPDFGFNWESTGHEKLKECCGVYMNHDIVRASVDKLETEATIALQTETSKNFPFLEYSQQYLLHHANFAAENVSQDEFLTSFPISSWISAHNIFEKFKVRKYSQNADLLYILAEQGFSNLIRARIKMDPNTNVHGERYRYPLFAALANGKKGAVAALLNTPSLIHDGVDVTEGIKSRGDMGNYKNRTPLSWAAEEGRIGLVCLLLQSGANIDEENEKHESPLSRALLKNHVAVARLLIQEGASICTSQQTGSDLLCQVIVNGYEALVKLLLETGKIDLNFAGKGAYTALGKAAEMGQEGIVKLLLQEEKLDVNSIDSHGWTALGRAVKMGHEGIVKLLLQEEKVDVNFIDRFGRTALGWAVSREHEGIVKLLLQEEKVDVNFIDSHGWTVLGWAAEMGHEGIVKLLLQEEKVDVNFIDGFGRTALEWAAHRGQEGIVKLLLATRGIESTPRQRVARHHYHWQWKTGIWK